MSTRATPSAIPSRTHYTRTRWKSPALQIISTELGSVAGTVIPISGWLGEDNFQESSNILALDQRTGAKNGGLIRPETDTGND